MALAGRTALVTGGGAGIGRAIAERLEAAGANVATVDVDPDTSPTIVRDVVDRPDELAAMVLERYGPIELIVNNVGLSPERRFLDLDEDEWDRIVAVNVRAPWFLTRALVRALVESRRTGSVLFISSLHDTFVRRAPHYSATKAGVAMLVKELAWELAPHEIRVNAISPGAIWTGEGAPPPNARVALGRLGRPEEVASIAAVLLDDDVAGYVTGANIRVDGGLALYNWLTDREP